MKLGLALSLLKKIACQVSVMSSEPSTGESGTSLRALGGYIGGASNYGSNSSVYMKASTQPLLTNGCNSCGCFRILLQSEIPQVTFHGVRHTQDDMGRNVCHAKSGSRIATVYQERGGCSSKSARPEDGVMTESIGNDLF